MNATGDEPTAANEPGAGLWRVFVIVLPKPGVNDPEGEAILGGLHGLGFDQVRQARAGRLFALEVAASSAIEATAQATAMAERLLANPVIQVYGIDRVEAADGEAERSW